MPTDIKSNVVDVDFVRRAEPKRKELGVSRAGESQLKQPSDRIIKGKPPDLTGNEMISLLSSAERLDGLEDGLKEINTTLRHLSLLSARMKTLLT